MNNLDVSIKDWYTKSYPSDSLGQSLNNTSTFHELDELLNSGDGDVYDLLGGYADSIIRERTFEKLSELKGCEYDEIYYKWISLSKSSESLEII